MSVLRHPAFFRAYRYFPHRLLNRAMRALCQATRPRFAIDLAVQAWIERDGIDLEDFEVDAWPTVEAFFLRRLRAGARPIGAGLVSTADGIVVAAGACERGTILQVKGRPISVDRLVHGAQRSAVAGSATRGPVSAPIDLAPFTRYVTVFLTPRGYHHVHMPIDGELVDVRWIPGRFFPQNEDALHHVDAIYERNERAVLRLSTAHGPIVLVMVGASLIGGIHLRDSDRAQWVRRAPTALGVSHAKGDALGHFSFGSTVVMLLPATVEGELPALGRAIRMGETLVG